MKPAVVGMGFAVVRDGDLERFHKHKEYTVSLTNFPPLAICCIRSKLSARPVAGFGRSGGIFNVSNFLFPRPTAKLRFHSGPGGTSQSTTGRGFDELRAMVSTLQFCVCIRKVTF